ncbi:hypothetical protein [Salinisphaera sp. G21_0]|uniref:hypothetical protein n=1 Tax=Salinisphaera sp. G21_0 TaxID=2821094 RepID=UPI001ADB2208|nr:hypothetical protein [Salinisphaera sp. G21_0]MBO9484746.1 hypothetical protein [Salinisphaera sp. G21_0]
MPVLLMLLSPSINADFTFKDYESLSKVQSTKERLSDYVVGVGRGIFWSNVLLKIQEKNRLFCPPSNLEFDEPVIMELLEDEIEFLSHQPGFRDDTPIELILTGSFAKKFPC